MAIRDSTGAESGRTDSRADRTCWDRCARRAVVHRGHRRAARDPRLRDDAGAADPPPLRWPAESAIPRLPDTATVVLFAHPDCPCTRASLAELAAVADTAQARAVISVVFADHDSGGAAGVPGAHAVVDHDGDEARRFGARTSGFVVVYDATGARRFAGGITAERGHVGDNIGRHAVLDAIFARPGESTHPVFGCALTDEEGER